MSLFVIAAAATTLATPLAVHRTFVDHGSGSHAIEYHAIGHTKATEIGIAPSARTSTQRCIVTVAVVVDRVIAGHHALRATLPHKQTYSRQFPGSCSGRSDEGAKLLAAKADDIEVHVARIAALDRPKALAALEAARHLAAN